MKKSSENTGAAVSPLLLLFLGACPAVAVTNSVLSALGMGAAVLTALALSTLIISLAGRAIPEPVRVPAHILIITAVVSAVSLLMNAFLPGIYQMLGVYLAVAAVDMLVFCKAGETGVRAPGAALVDSLVTGAAFLVVLTVTAAIREVLGSGSFAGIALDFMKDYTIGVLAQPAGGLLMFAILLAVVNRLYPGKPGEAESFACSAAGVGGVDKREGGI